MTSTLRPTTRSHAALIAAVTALLFGAAILVQAYLQSFISIVAAQQATGQMLVSTFGYGLLSAIPFAAGFFLSLWVVAPISGSLPLAQVIARALLATAVGAGVFLVVLAVLAITGAFGISGPLFGNSLGAYFDRSRADYGLGSAFSTAIGSLVRLLPLGVLAGVLLWGWRRDREPRHPAI